MFLALLLRKRLWVRTINPITLVIWLVFVFTAHAVGMFIFEGFTPFEAVWMTATTIVTVGFGDFFPKTTEGRLTTMALYATGIFTLATAVNVLQEANENRRERKRRGQWKWKMKDHIVFVSPKTGQHEQFIADVVQEIRASGSSRHAMVLSLGEADGLPTRFEALDIAIVRTTKIDMAAMTAASLSSAHTVVVMDDDDINTGSAFVVDTLSRLHGHCESHFVAESTGEDEARIKRMGAERIVRPFRSYPELLAREIVAPGSAAVVQELFSASGVTLVRVDMPKTTFERWDNSVIKLMRGGFGTPIAYYSTEKGMVCCPHPEDKHHIDAYYVVAANPQKTQSSGQKIYDLITTHDLTQP